MAESAESGFERKTVAIVGASTLLGKELKRALEERNFAGLEIELFDEDPAAVGVLAEAGGEAAVVRGVDEEEFRGMKIVFVAARGKRSAETARAALASGATVIDMNPGMPVLPDSSVEIPELAMKPPERTSADSTNSAAARVVRIPPAAVSITAAISASLERFAPERTAIVFFPPVSERGQAGIEELESQIARLLAVQPIEQSIFDAQVAFNLMTEYGNESAHDLAEERAAAAKEIRTCAGSGRPVPAIQFIQAPVFYGYAFSVFADFGKPADVAAIAEALAGHGMKVEADAPNNISVADDAFVHTTLPSTDPNSQEAIWLWGAVDHLRMAAASAVGAAERLLGA